jgi:hypothetical protein
MMDITPTPATTMMDRGSISVDIITPPAVSKTGKPGSKPGFFFVQETAFFFATQIDSLRRPFTRTHAVFLFVSSGINPQRGIQLNRRLSLRHQFHALSSTHAIRTHIRRSRQAA